MRPTPAQLTMLVTAAREGDKDAYSGVVRAFQDMVFGYATALLGDFHQAEDVAQEALVEAYLHLGQLRDVAAFPGWLRRIVFHCAQRALRRRHPSLVALDAAGQVASADPSPLQQAAAHEAERSVREAIASLSPPLREVTTLFYVDGYAHGEIAGFLEMPLGTIKSRLNASRKVLKGRLATMVEETLGKHKPTPEFARRVIEGVPRIGYQAQGSKVELCPFPSALKACLESIGQSIAYEELMAASGAAFRLVWSPRCWDGGNVDLMVMASDPLEPYRRAAEATGRVVEALGNSDAPHAALPGHRLFSAYASPDVLRRRIVESIRDRGRPVIALGVVGPPEAAIVTGYDDEGAVLMGWSYFQDMPALAGDVGFEPSGYFRQRVWWPRTPGVFLIGEPCDRLPGSERDRRVLEWALAVARTPNVHGRASGLAAYEAWASDLGRDDDFPEDDTATLLQRLEVHDDAMMTVAEGRWYASVYLSQMARRAPFMAEHLLAAASCHAAEHRLMWEGWALVGGIGRGSAQASALAAHDVRDGLARVVRAAQAKDREAADHVERALAVKT